MKMEDEWHKKVISQDQAVKAVAKAMRRSRSGLRDPTTADDGCFPFAGSTGVGKTLAKRLAEFMFADSPTVLIQDRHERVHGSTTSAA